MSQTTRHDQQRQLKYLQSLGDWNQSKLEKISLDSGKCPCGFEHQTWKHLALDCPRLAEPRAKHAHILGLFEAGFPQCMLQGLMPALPLNPDSIMGKDDGTCAISTLALYEQYKIPLGPQWKFDESTQCYRESLLHLGQQTRINARQFLDYRRGVFDIPETRLPTRCTEAPPELPNSYSDGGVTNPTYSEYQFGGAGIWWPGRKIESAPLHINELEQHHEITQDGISIWGAIPGQRCDSTRAEIIAATGILAAPGPIHTGVDSLNFIKYA